MFFFFFNILIKYFERAGLQVLRLYGSKAVFLEFLLIYVFCSVILLQESSVCSADTLTSPEAL